MSGPLRSLGKKLTFDSYKHKNHSRQTLHDTFATVATKWNPFLLFCKMTGGLSFLDQDTLRSSEIISDDNWHFVRYRRNEKMLFLTVDENTVNLASAKSDPNTSYGILYIGDINSVSMNFTIEVEDFIWEYENTEVNFVKGVYESFGSSNDEYMIMPSGVIPIFNWKLSTRNKMTNMPPTTGIVL